MFKFHDYLTKAVTDKKESLIMEHAAYWCDYDKISSLVSESSLRL